MGTNRSLSSLCAALKERRPPWARARRSAIEDVLEKDWGGNGEEKRGSTTKTISTALIGVITWVYRSSLPTTIHLFVAWSARMPFADPTRDPMPVEWFLKRVSRLGFVWRRFLFAKNDVSIRGTRLIIVKIFNRVDVFSLQTMKRSREDFSKPCVYFMEKMECFQRKDRKYQIKYGIRSLCAKQLLGTFGQEKK